MAQELRYEKLLGWEGHGGNIPGPECNLHKDCVTRDQSASEGKGKDIIETGELGAKTRHWGPYCSSLSNLFFQRMVGSYELGKKCMCLWGWDRWTGSWPSQSYSLKTILQRQYRSQMGGGGHIGVTMEKPLKRLGSGTRKSSGILVPLSLIVNTRRGTRLKQVGGGQEREAAV